jgi:murein L,D-transpeptidase YafK
MVLAVALAGCQESTLSRNNPSRGSMPLSEAVASELTGRGLARSSPVLMRIFKQEAELEVWKKDASGRYVLFKTYPICNYSGDLGPKVREGDRQSPEGFYTITMSQMNPQSNYYLAFNMGFPNAFDRSYGRSGSHLMVHGDCSSRGCYAMTDEAIAEVYALAREAMVAGQEAFQVQAYPFRMTPRNLARHRANPNMAFWRNLKEGYDHFEVTRQEPQVDVCNRQYVFNAVAPDSTLAQSGGGSVREMIGADPWAGTRANGAVRRSSAATTTAATPVPVSLNQPVTTIAPVDRAAPAPARSTRTRFTAVSDDGSPRPSFQAAAACPAYVIPPAIRQAVAQKNARDMAQVAALSPQIEAAPARSGIDGGTHQRFAARFADRRIRVGSSEPGFSLAASESAPVALVSARSAPEAAPVAGPAAATPVSPVIQPAAAPQAAAPMLASATSRPVTLPVAGTPAQTSVVQRSPSGAPVAAFAPAEPPPQPLPAAQPGNWFSRLTGQAPAEAPAAEAPAAPASGPTAAPLPLPRPHASAPGNARIQ